MAAVNVLNCCWCNECGCIYDRNESECPGCKSDDADALRAVMES